MSITKRESTFLSVGLGVSLLGIATLIQAHENREMYSSDNVRKVYPNSGVNRDFTDLLSTETIVSQISSTSDDAEEGASGKVYLDSSNIEIDDHNISADPTVGLRFNNLMIPQGAIITHAVIKFTAGENRHNDNVNFYIEAHFADNASSFSSAPFDLSNREKTAATVGWTPSSWLSGLSYNTPNLASMVQEVVDRGGWTNGNSMAFLIMGSGSRSSRSHDGKVAPVLTIQYELPAAMNT